MNTDLLSIIDTKVKYEEFKQALRSAAIVEQTPVGPLYRAVPSVNSPIDAFDMDRQLMSTNRQFSKTYSRILHANLTGQYRLAANGGIPRLASPRMLDQHSLAVYFSPFRPKLGVPPDKTILSRWDRNTARVLPATTIVTVEPNDPRLYFARNGGRDAFARLIPLYTNYRQPDDSLLNRVGVPLNRNSMLIVRYIKAMNGSAIQYREKLKQVAELVYNTELLKRKRKDLVKRLAEVQRNKMREIRESAAEATNLNYDQRRVVDAFVQQFQVAAQEIIDYDVMREQEEARQAEYNRQQQEYYYD